ncbi:MAG: aquaporin [Candidatus Poseidoniaceae archaeon]|nr:aquaporin [Candidatus Poseidoniaceae archaeon]|tara:strand:- start:446 stop:1054 length:609 start_codon:yes stop_codon:yes gene_type:complete
MRTEFLSELVGTFFMVFIGCYSIKAGYSPMIISCSFGFAVFIVILTSRKYSGAHINPAVSIAFSITGQLENKLLVPYLIAQFTGGIIAAYLVGDFGATEFSVDTSFGIGIEVLITFVLMMSIYLTIFRTDNDLIVALIVGSVVACLAFIFGTYTGASMNPARTLGPNLISNSISVVPIYLISTIFGSCLAAYLVKIKISNNQ